MLCLCVSELKEAAERAQAQYRSEKQRRKEMELRVNNMEEELQDLKSDKESLERVRTLHVFFLLSVNGDRISILYRGSALNITVHRGHHGNEDNMLNCSGLERIVVVMLTNSWFLCV